MYYMYNYSKTAFTFFFLFLHYNTWKKRLVKNIFYLLNVILRNTIQCYFLSFFSILLNVNVNIQRSCKKNERLEKPSRSISENELRSSEW